MSTLTRSSPVKVVPDCDKDALRAGDRADECAISSQSVFNSSLDRIRGISPPLIPYLGRDKDKLRVGGGNNERAMSSRALAIYCFPAYTLNHEYMICYMG
jgi:hypothetical protein